MVKRKIENRSFQDRWETDYMFIMVKEKPICLVCGANMSVSKEYNIRRHFETRHHDKYKDLNANERLKKVEEMKKGLMSRQTMFTKAKSQSEASVKASFIVAQEITKSARHFNEGEYVKMCMVKICEVVCAKKKQAFLNVSLSRNTVAERACELATNLQEQLMRKGEDFVAYSLAVDEMDKNVCVTEELLGLKSMHGTTTGKDIFEEVSKSPAMCGQKTGLVGRMRDKMREKQAGELTVYHCIIHQEALCGKALKMDHIMNTVTQVRCFELREEICLFMESKGKDTTEFRDKKVSIYRSLIFFSVFVFIIFLNLFWFQYLSKNSIVIYEDG
ncbi:hypothetical protein Q5P01_000472 [Channa striata]|uniref:SPIN-DOC-like zinc-finger domain-containing protein n=1 Tax=Channa striata TaxID=64152 RepID=A0AA88LFU5_CHASR|nr:hypothetical protein Q5P01_000472 [Channa striata]